MSLQSMTGFASLPGAADGVAWTWEARSVNGRGLDLRLRLPEGCEGLDPELRAAAKKVFGRGSVAIGLRMARDAGAAVPRLNEEMLEAVIVAARAARDVAARNDLVLADAGVAELLSLRGVMEAETVLPGGGKAVQEALKAQAPELMAALFAARGDEGRSLEGILSGRLDTVERLTTEARACAEARQARSGDLLRERVTVVLDGTAEVDPDRLAQELALLAVKADVSEELDRLQAHVGAARELLAREGPVGRRLDFLTQEFNREANTLCSKAGSAELTAIGLELKVVVDQIGEQVQNVE